MALQRLKEAAEKAKIELSSATQTQINLPFITATQEGPKHLDMMLSRSKFESLVSDLITRSIDPCKIALKDAKLNASDIDEVILVGGSTRMPAIQEQVEKFFGRKPHKGVNPDEVVAIGAAIQGGILGGDVQDVVLLDVTPLSLGIETLGGVMTRLIDANSTIPVKRTEVFSTAADNQQTVDIHVLQGEREMAAANKTIGRFQLTGIPPAPRGVPQIEVSFDIDANGILSVSAKDKSTGKEQSIKIEASSGLSKDEIDKMKQDAKAHADEDKKRREEIDLRNEADSRVYQTRKQIEELKEQMSTEDRGTLEDKVNALENALKGSDLDAIRKANEELTAAWSEIGTRMHQAAGGGQPGAEGFGGDAGAGAAGGEQTGGGDEDVETADYEVVDDEEEKK